MQDNQPHAKPFSAENTKSVICKIIFFYSVFYVVMKIIAIFKGSWVMPNLILCVPFLLFAGLGFKMTKTKNYSWLYVIAGALVISFVRYYEIDLMHYLHEKLA